MTEDPIPNTGGSRPQPADTEELARQAAGGDRTALRHLVTRTYPGLLAAARARLRRWVPGLRRRLETADLAQSAYGDALRSLPRFHEKGRGSFRAWLSGILRNKIRRRVAFFRARRRDHRHEASLDRAAMDSAAAGASALDPAAVAGPGSLPEERLLMAEDRERLLRQMERLSARHREVLRWRYYEDLPWREVGEHLGVSEEAAQMLCQRAIRELRLAFESGDGRSGSSSGAGAPRRA